MNTVRARIGTALKLATALAAFAQPPACNAEPVTVDNFVRAESDKYLGAIALKEGGFGKFFHNRDVTPIERQNVIRQNRDTAGFALVSRMHWMNLYVGNLPRDPERERRAMPEFAEYTKLGDTVQERDEAARRLALEAIRDRMPWWPLQKVAETLPRMLTPNSLLTQRMLSRPDTPGAYSRAAYRTRADGTGFEWIRTLLAYVAVASWAALLLAGNAGIALAWGRPLVGAFLLFIGFQILPTIVAFSFSRYRVPFLPILGIGAAWLALEGRTAWRAARLRTRVAVALPVAAAAALAGTRWWSVVGPHGG